MSNSELNPKSKILIEKMSELHQKGIDCQNCTGKCCTSFANSMMVTTEETDRIYDYLFSRNQLNSQLVEKLDETIKDFRLDKEIHSKNNKLFRKTYTCPFFAHQSLGCALPANVKPYGCLAFNPTMAGVQDGESCESDIETLEDIDKKFGDESVKKSIPIALKEKIIKERILSSDIIISKSTNPYINLALEDFILRDQNPHKKNKALFYVNEPSIVFGKFQNPWLEFNVPKALNKGLKIVRRQSGGGTVYHDKGNLNFCFFSKKPFCDRKSNLEKVADLLSSYNIEAKINERNDLVVELDEKKYKISGSAFKQVKNYGFHHGTLLIDANIESLREVLKPEQLNISSKSVRSVSSPVLNLNKVSPINIEQLIERFLDRERSSNEKLNFSIVEEPEISHLDFAKYKDWKWIWGQTPKFELKLASDTLLTAEKGQFIESSCDDYKEVLRRSFLSVIADQACFQEISSFFTIQK